MPQIAAPIKAKGGAQRSPRRAEAPSPASLLARKLLPAGGAELAGGALAAAISPIEPLAALAEVAGVRLFHDQPRQAFAAKLLGETPGGRLVDPHQRREDRKIPVHTQRKRRLGRANRRVAAIGIAGVVGFAHAADERADPAPVSQSGGEGQEQNIAARHEGVGKAGGAKGDLGLPGQRRLRDFAQRRNSYRVILAKTSAPRWRHSC